MEVSDIQASALSAASARRGFRDEAGALLRLGAPIAATQLCVMGMGFLDTAMAGRYGAADLAGVNLGGAVLWPAFMLLTGITMAVMPMVSQLVGARRTGESGPLIRHGVWIALFNSVLMMLLMRNVEPALVLLDVDREVTAIAVGYLRAASWGMPAMMAYILLRQVCEGLGHTLPPMLIAGTAFVLNAPLNYVLIYGALGFPELGGVGCGWATAAVMWVELGLILLVARRPFFRATNWLGGETAFRWATVVRIFKLGVPIGATIFLEMAVYSAISVLIARLGVSEMAAHSVAGNINWATYVIPMSLGSAAAIRVGFHVGARHQAGAAQVVSTAFRISLGYALAVSVLLVGLRFLLVGIYTTDADVALIAANLLIFIAVYQMFDCTNATMAGALRGYKDTRVPMIISLIGYWLIALPLGALLADGAFGLSATGVYGYWAGMTFGLALVAVAMGLRLRRTSRDAALIERLAQG